jgi:hypothetical protein
MESREIQGGTASAQEQESNEVEAAPGPTENKRTTQRNAPTALSRWLRRGAVIALFLACLEMGGNIFYHYSYAASYRPAQCLIQYTQVEYVQPSSPNRSSPYYQPEVIYQVILPPNANPDTYPGYAGPGSFQEQMNTSGEAQALLNRYQVGQTYPCWYSSFGIQSEAVLVFQPFAWWEIVLTSLAALTLGFLCSMIIFLLILFIFRVRRLRKKGVVTTGTVGEEQIEFITSSDLIERVHVPYAKARYKPGLEVSVIYDPQDPHHSFRIARSLRGEEIAAWCFLVVLWLPLTVFLLALLWAA